MRNRFRTSLICLSTLLVAPAVAVDTSFEVEVRELIDTGRAREAVDRIEAHSPDAQRDADTWFLLAEAYHAWMDEAGLLKKRGLANKMKHSLEAALAIDPDHVDARRELIDFLHYAPWIGGGNEEEAQRQLEILERLDPGAAWSVRGDHARSAGDLDAARDHYRAAVEAGPREPQQLFLLAVVEQQLGGYPESLTLLDEVIETDPHHEKAYYYRARASAMAELELDRGLECARHYIETCVECDESDRSYGWWRQATILKRQGDTSAAIAAYREALRLNPELEGARLGLEELEP